MALAALACTLTLAKALQPRKRRSKSLPESLLNSEFSSKDLRKAITTGLAGAALPARFEPVQKDPLVIVDGAHTPNSVTATLETFTSLVDGEKTLLFGCAVDKKYRDLVKILAPHFTSIIVTKPGSFKESNPQVVFETFKELGAHVELVPDTRTAIAKALANASELQAGLLVTGSFYLCAEVKKFLENPDQGISA
jgi:dihydrofolate synthase/folylpolyglutamate synthase